MFDFIRKHTKIIMVLLFLLIIPSFVLFGIGDYTRANAGATKVAEVGGEAITQDEWDHALRQESDRLRGSNPTLDAALLDTPDFRFAVLERLLRSRVLATAAQDQRLLVSDARLAAWLEREPLIAELRRPDGSVDAQRYRQLLARQGLTPESFEAGARADLASQQVLAALAESSLSDSVQSQLALDALREQRQVRLAHFKTADYSAKVQPTDAQLQDWYDSHKADYQAPEAVDIEYLLLDPAQLAQNLTVSEDDLRTYYQQNAGLLGTPEQRSASHILIAVPAGAAEADRDEAKAKAEALLAQLRQNPDSFADVARQQSQDPGSASSGGDLGSFERNKGMDPAIANATFALKAVGDISEPVASDFGWHILRLTGIAPGTVPPFEQMRAQLTQKVREQEAQKQFRELAEEFGNLVYEQSDSLQPAAEKLKLSLQTAQGITRSPAADATGPLANPRLLNALFSSDALDKKRNTEALNVGNNQLISARVTAHRPAHARSFEEVKEQVRQAYVQDNAARLAREAGQTSLDKWTAQPAEAKALGPSQPLARNLPQDQSQALIEAVLRADPSKLPAFVGVDEGAGGYTIAQVEKVLPLPELTADELDNSRTEYTQFWSLAETERYYQYLQNHYKARILAPRPAATAP